MCISMKSAIGVMEPGFMRGPKQGDSEFIYYLDCTSHNMDHCIKEPSLGGSKYAQIPGIDMRQRVAAEEKM